MNRKCRAHLARWLLLPVVLIAILLASTAVAAGGELKINVTTWPPGLPLETETWVLIYAEGLEPGWKQVWRATLFEGDELEQIKKVIDGQWQTCWWFSGVKPGERTFEVQIPLADPPLDPIARITFQYGNDENPPPPPPPGVKTVVIIEESDVTVRTPEIGNLLTRLRIDAEEGWIKEQGHVLLILDRQQQVTDTAGNKTPHPLVAAHLDSDDRLPVVVVLVDGQVISKEPFPKTYAEVRELIEGKD